LKLNRDRRGRKQRMSEGSRLTILSALRQYVGGRGGNGETDFRRLVIRNVDVTTKW
jgi:hypothetical protein